MLTPYTTLHEELAQTIGCKILDEAERKFLVESAIVHRVGDLSVADIAVWVASLRIIVVILF